MQGVNCISECLCVCVCVIGLACGTGGKLIPEYSSFRQTQMVQKKQNQSQIISSMSRLAARNAVIEWLCQVDSCYWMYWV